MLLLTKAFFKKKTSPLTEYLNAYFNIGKVDFFKPFTSVKKLQHSVSIN